MNALNWQAYSELEQVFLNLQKDAEVRCIILTGNGRAFCSGDDVREIMVKIGSGEGGSNRLRDIRPGTTPAARAILECDRPIIAAVNGAAVGWGMDVFDGGLPDRFFRRKFEAIRKAGLVADVGGLVHLQDRRPTKSSRAFFTGDIITAEEGRNGIVLQVTSPDELLVKLLNSRVESPAIHRSLSVISRKGYAALTTVTTKRWETGSLKLWALYFRQKIIKRALPVSWKSESRPFTDAKDDMPAVPVSHYIT